MKKLTMTLIVGIAIGALGASIIWNGKVNSARAAMDRALSIARESVKHYEQEEREYVKQRLDSLLRLDVGERERYLLEGLLADTTGRHDVHDTTRSRD